MLVAPPPPATIRRPVAIYDTECFPNYWLLKFRPKAGPVYSFRIRAGQRFTDQDIARMRLLFEAYTTVSFNGRGYDVPMITAALMGYTGARGSYRRHGSGPRRWLSKAIRRPHPLQDNARPSL